MDKWAPRMTDRFVERMLISGTHSGQPREGKDALHEPGEGLLLAALWRGHDNQSSVPDRNIAAIEK